MSDGVYVESEWDGKARRLLIASYLYYVCDFSWLEDTEYDLLCREVADHFDELSQYYKDILKDNSFGSVGSLFMLKEEDYTPSTKGYALYILQKQGK